MTGTLDVEAGKVAGQLSTELTATLPGTAGGSAEPAVVRGGSAIDGADEGRADGGLDLVGPDMVGPNMVGLGLVGPDTGADFPVEGDPVAADRAVDPIDPRPSLGEWALASILHRV